MSAPPGASALRTTASIAALKLALRNTPGLAQRSFSPPLTPGSQFGRQGTSTGIHISDGSMGKGKGVSNIHALDSSPTPQSRSAAVPPMSSSSSSRALPTSSSGQLGTAPLVESSATLPTVPGSPAPSTVSASTAGGRSPYQFGLHVIPFGQAVPAELRAPKVGAVAPLARTIDNMGTAFLSAQLSVTAELSDNLLAKAPGLNYPVIRGRPPTMTGQPAFKELSDFCVAARIPEATLTVLLQSFGSTSTATTAKSIPHKSLPGLYVMSTGAVFQCNAGYKNLAYYCWQPSTVRTIPLYALPANNDMTDLLPRAPITALPPD